MTHLKRFAVLIVLGCALGVASTARAAMPLGDQARDMSIGNEDRRVTGLGHVFTIGGLELLDEVWQNRQNPNPPAFCGGVVRQKGRQGVWVKDVDAAYGRQTQRVSLQLGRGEAIVEVDAPATKPYGLTPPKGCENANYFEVAIESPVAGGRAEDDMGQATAWLPPAQGFPFKNTVLVVADDDQPEAELFKDYDITGLYAAVDNEWLYLSLKVEGEISDGTSTPPEGHLYSVLLMDPKEGDRVLQDRVNGFSLQYMSLYKLANQPAKMLLRLRQDRTKLEDNDVEVQVDKGTVHWRVRRKAIKFAPDRPLKVIAVTGEARLGPGTVHLTVKDLTTTGQLQVVPAQ